MPLQIGVTGGIGSGKSTVARIFHALGISVYDADSRAKFLMTTDGNLIQAIKKEFGNLAYNPDESLNRSYLGTTVFNSPEKRELLNRLTHPAVARDYAGWVARHRSEKYILKDAALLIETGSWKELDKIVLVISPEDLRIERILKRDPQRKEEDIRKIMHAQMSDQEKSVHADFVLINDESRLLIPQVMQVHDQLLRLARHQ